MPYLDNIVKREDVGLPPPDERVDVLLALALNQSPASEACPSIEELSAWYEQRLAVPRKTEVEAHVVRCEHCYDIWSGLLDAAETNRESPSQDEKSGVHRHRRWVDWRPGWAGFGFISLCATLLVTILLVSQRPQWSPYESIEEGYLALLETGLAAAVQEKWIWSSNLQIRSLDSTEGISSERIWQRGTAQRAFQYGVRVGLQRMVDANGFWRGAVQALPSSPGDCTGSREAGVCEAINRAFYELGRWAVLVHFACDVTTSFALSSRLPNQLPLDFWIQQVDLMAELDESVEAALPNSGFARFFSEWRREAEHPTRPRTILCSREAALLSLGLQ